jgi:hypothetical protein
MKARGPARKAEPGPAITVSFRYREVVGIPGDLLIRASAPVFKIYFQSMPAAFMISAKTSSPSSEAI